MKPSVSGSNPGTGFPEMQSFYLKLVIFLRCALASQRLFCPLSSVLVSPLSKRCCRCAGIVLQNGCQVANRVTDVCGESVIRGITSEISRQRAGCKFVCALVNMKWFPTSIKEAVFCNFDWAYLSCRVHPPPPSHIPCDEEDR